MKRAALRFAIVMIVGLYQEPDWVAQHPGFQRDLRSRIAANRW